MTRRELLAGAATSAAGLAAWRATGATGSDERLDFLLLGDIHFDALELHDQDWLAREKPGDVRQVQSYSRITREVLPKLLDEVRGHVRANPHIRFVAHVGDLVEGLAGTPALARRQAAEATRLIDAAGLGVPFLFVKGNHDVTGPGAAGAFDEVLLPWVARQAGQQLTSGSFTTRQGDSLFVWFDAYAPDSLAWLRRTLDEQPAKQVFFVIHPPVVPCSARANWHIYARPEQSHQRAELLELLGHHRAVVLCGHVHKCATLVRSTPAGPFAQVTVLSVVPDPAIEPKDRIEGVERYAVEVASQEGSFSPDSLEERKALLRAEAPLLRHFEYADATGYALVSVTGGQIAVKHYAGLGNRCWRTVALSPLLAQA